MLTIELVGAYLKIYKFFQSFPRLGNLPYNSHISAILIRGGHVVSSKGMRLADVLYENGEVKKVGDNLQSEPHADLIEAEGMLLFPGLIDCHVHFREPGLEHKATLESEARCARLGGITTVCEMPNTVPPTVTIVALADKVRRAEKVRGFDFHFFFGVTEAAHLHALRELWTGESAELRRLKKYCCGVKLFLDHSTGNQMVARELIDDIFAACAKLHIPLVAHCEDPEINAAAAQANKSTDISAHSLMRPPESEASSISFALEKVRTHGTALHIAHLSTKQGIELVRQAKKDGLPVTCEVCPHHLLLLTDDYSWLGTRGKMNPPLRSADHLKMLWKGIADHTVDCVSTDHAPHTIDEKNALEALKAPSGVPGVETMVPLLLSVVAGKWPTNNQKRITNYELRITPEDILRLCFTNPNQIFSLGREEISEGAKTPIVIIDPAVEWTISAENQHSKCGWTPYEGWNVTGKVMQIVGS